MNLQQLKILVMIAEHKKITVAADKLQLKHSTVKFHMQKLEEYIGAPLYERRNNRVFLTHAAELLLPYARTIVSSAHEAEAVLFKAIQNSESKITIGCTATLSKHFLSFLLPRLRRSFPEVSVDVKIEKPETIVQLLQDYRIDFGFLMEHHISGQQFSMIPLYDDVYGIVLFPSHPLAKVESIHPIQVEDDQWLIRETGTLSRRMFDEWVSRHHLQLRHVTELGATEAIKDAVLSKLGISILGYIPIMEEIRQGKLIFKQLDLMKTQKLCFIYHKERSYTPLMKQLIRFFSTEKPELPSLPQTRPQ